MASNLNAMAESRASRPLRALVTRNPLRVRPVSSISRMERSSSAIRICGCWDISCLRAGNPQGESGAPPDFAPNGDGAVVEFRDFANQREAEAGTGNSGVLHAGNA